MKIRSMLIAAALAAVAWTSRADAQTTRAVHVSSSAARYAPPVINDDETVAFLHHSGRANADWGLLGVDAGGAITTLATAGPYGLGYAEISPHISINGAGTVAFWAKPRRGSAELIAYADASGTHTAARAPQDFGSFGAGTVPGRVSINDQGQIAFEARPAPLSNATGIYLYTPSTQSTSVLEDPTAWPSFGLSPVLHPTTSAVAYGTLHYTPSHVGVRARSAGGAVTTLAASGLGPASVTSVYLDRVAMHEGGCAYFIAKRTGDPDYAVFGASTGGGLFPWSTVGVHTSIAEVAARGHFVTFLANGPSGRAIYANQIGHGGGVFAAVAVGDTIAGAHVVDLAMSREALNTHDQLVFWAALDDGTEGVFVKQLWYTPPIGG